MLIVAVLGALAALTGILTARGSKFWQKNWEAHVDFLEGAVEGDLHTTALLDDGVSYSVSRVNERFLKILLAGWIASFAAAATVISTPWMWAPPPALVATAQIAVPLLFLVTGSLWLTIGQRSRLHGRAFHRSTMARWEPGHRRNGGRRRPQGPPTID